MANKIINIPDLGEVEEVEVIEEAICTWVLHQKNGFKKYNVSFKKIRIKSTGEEGWTFSSTVKIPD